MLTNSGYFDRQWLYAQDTARLRYEARCERVQGWDTMHRHKLIMVLGQLRIVGTTAVIESAYSGN